MTLGMNAMPVDSVSVLCI